LGLIKIAALVPAIMLTLGLTLGMTPQPKSVKGKVILADSGDPATGAAIVIKNGTEGTVVDTEGEFIFNVDGDPELVISFVGYATQTIKASKIGKKPIKLEREAFKVDLQSVNADEGEVILTPKESKAVIDSEGTHDTGNDPVFYIVESMPMFPGGKSALKKYIYSNLQYPASAKEQKISGEVLVQFVVMPSGKLDDIKVARSSFEGFNKSAIQVFKGMPDWNPGSQRGKPVKVQVIVPVRFNSDNG
jgi:TonB family protein